MDGKDSYPLKLKERPSDRLTISQLFNKKSSKKALSLLKKLIANQSDG